MLWLSLLVLLPLAAVVAKATGAGWSGFTAPLTDGEAFAAIRLTRALLARGEPGERGDGHR